MSKISSQLRLSVTLAVITHLLPITSHAERDYAIEMVIFNSNQHETFSSEKWPQQWRLPDKKNSINLNTVPKKFKDSIRILSDEESTLAPIAQTINESKRYSLISYKRWRQPGLNMDDAVDIRLSGGKRYLQKTPDDKRFQTTVTTPETANPNIEQQTIIYQSLIVPGESSHPMELTSADILTVEYLPYQKGITSNEKTVLQLDGNIKVVISRFIHIYIDTLLYVPVNISRKEKLDAASFSMAEYEEDQYLVSLAREGDTFTTLQGINIKTHRRMRSNELHFIDHPLLGIITKVSRIEEAKEEQ